MALRPTTAMEWRKRNERGLNDGVTEEGVREGREGGKEGEGKEGRNEYARPCGEENERFDSDFRHSVDVVSALPERAQLRSFLMITFA